MINNKLQVLLKKLILVSNIDKSGKPIFTSSLNSIPFGQFAKNRSEITVDEAKGALLKFFQKRAFEEENKLLPTRTLLCVLLENNRKEINIYKKTKAKFKEELNRLNELIETIQCKEDIEKIDFTTNFPSSLVEDNSKTKAK